MGVKSGQDEHTRKATGEARTAARLEASDGVAILRLDRPPLNALNRAAQHDLHRAAAEASTNPDIRAVVLHGGATSFSAGADIKEMAGMSHVEMAQHAPALQAAFTAVAEIPKPVIAAINGAALGGGCELALAADFRICALDSIMGLPEVRLGVIPGAGGTQRLPRLVGIGTAKDLIFSGRTLSAADAARIGLVDEVLPPDEVLPKALRLAQSFTTGAVMAVAAAKRAIDGGMARNLQDGLALERAEFAALFATADRRLGMQAFARGERGAISFEGR